VPLSFDSIPLCIATSFIRERGNDLAQGLEIVRLGKCQCLVIGRWDAGLRMSSGKRKWYVEGLKQARDRKTILTLQRHVQDGRVRFPRLDLVYCTTHSACWPRNCATKFAQPIREHGSYERFVFGDQDVRHG
jgi:hypothetical protein